MADVREFQWPQRYRTLGDGCHDTCLLVQRFENALLVCLIECQVVPVIYISQGRSLAENHRPGFTCPVLSCLLRTYHFHSNFGAVSLSGNHRPLVTSPNRRRAGRRLPAVRRIPCSGPVILAALDESSEEQAGVKTPTGESRVGAPGGIRRKQPRPVDMTNLGEQRSCQKRHPGLIQCSPGTEDSWLKLRRILHERYRDFEEREAAEESSAGARCMEDSIMKSTYGKILSQGLW